LNAFFQSLVTPPGSSHIVSKFHSKALFSNSNSA